jgi:ACS family sodium-dependent inorganic phosphate cotransporter/ACS family sodium-dependent inorganic phosphate cotransporter-like MFS transporter 9
MAVAVLPMAAEFGWPPSIVGVVQSAFLWGYAATQLAGGALADAHGGRAVLAAGIVVFSIAQAITPAALLPAVAAAGLALPALLAARAAVGAGEGVALPSMSALVAAHVPPARRATALGAAFAGFHCGNLLGLAVSPLLLAWAGWRGLFAVFGVAGLPLLAGWLALVPKPAPKAAATATAAAPTPPPPVRALLAHPATWAIIAANVANHWGYFVYLTWLPSYFASTLGAGVASASALAFGPWLAMAAGSAGAGVLADALVRGGVAVRTVRVSLQTVAFLTPATVLIVLARAGPAIHPPTASALFAAALGASSLGQAGFVANMGDVAPSGAGAMFGLCNTFGSAAGIVGVTAAGAIVQATGSFAPLFYVTAGLYVVGATVFGGLARGERVF